LTEKTVALFGMCDVGLHYVQPNLLLLALGFFSVTSVFSVAKAFDLKIAAQKPTGPSGPV
jgi:hypothetical protein